MLASLGLWSQNGFHEHLDTRDLPDSARIDLLNDHAWTLI